MVHSSLADLMSLFSDLVDFWRSAHEALLERRRKRAQSDVGAAQHSDATDAPAAN